MSNEVVLDAHGLFKKYGHHVVIKSFDVTLNQGDVLGLIGPNGAGKTTIVKMITGLLSMNGGSVLIHGFDIKKNFKEAIKEVGAIIENPDLYMYLSGYENLKMIASLYKIEDNRILEVAQLVGLTDRIHDKVRKYSLGMRQRLGIAQAILHQPSILILDEPMNGLDPDGIIELKNLIKKLSNEGMAVIISSHLLLELESICNRIVMIHQGEIIFSDYMEQVKAITEEARYLFWLSNTNLEQILFCYEVVDKEHIRVFSTKDEIQNIIKCLLLNGILIYEMKIEKKSLEELFMSYKKMMKS